MNKLVLCLALVSLAAVMAAAENHHGDQGLNGLDEEKLPEAVEEMLRRDPAFVLAMLTKLRSSMIKPLEK